MDGRKIPSLIENPIDNVLIDISTAINPYLRKLGFTPNILTIVSFVTGIYAAWLIWKSRFILAAIFIFISYLLDCMDGNMARMFDMVTPFGDYLDHISDISKYSLIFAAILWNDYISFKHKTIFAFVILTFTFLTQIHFGCQEKSYDKRGSDSLSVLEPLCRHAYYIQYTRFFGMGTTVLVFIIFVISFSFTRRKLFV